MSAAATPSHSQQPTIEEVAATVRKHWGYESLLPNQREAIQSVLDGRDSVVVLPTGGGKSLCYQAPACCMSGTAVVVSPLIALMKDQVDALREIGIEAAAFNSTLSWNEKKDVVDSMRAGTLKLLYLAPESLLAGDLLQVLQSVRVSLFAVDEAHCISSWGHDFRPEYRQLRILKQRFPGVAVHGYTATATERVREDIAVELGLDQAEMIVGSFDRPNLEYRVEQRGRGIGQLVDVLKRHPGESGIVYCITRKEVERTADALKALGHRVAPYHAGMDTAARTKNQEAFLAERIDVIVATVAFGMGIDKSNVRFVAHTGMPKSLEAYQQESGRAGRDGLEAECCLLYSSGDAMKWKRLIQPAETGYEQAMAALEGISRFCATPRCRHQQLVEHFGQHLDSTNCGACDVCSGTLDEVEDPLVVSQKILSCIARLKEQFGGDYTAKVLTGSEDQRILQNGHNNLSTYGLLSEETSRSVRDWIEQLVGQGCAVKQGEFNQLTLTELGWQVLRGEHTPRLLVPAKKPPKETRRRTDTASWEGVDRELFEELRDLRREIASEKGVPAYIVFGDGALRDMARRRPTTEEGFLECHGVGQKKWAEYGKRFLGAITGSCQERGVASDVTPPDAPLPRKAEPADEAPPEMSATAIPAFELFKQGLSVEEAATRLGRAVSTTHKYLEQFLRHEQVTDPTPWVDRQTIDRIHDAITEVGSERLRPIYDHLEGEVPFEEIRIVAHCLANAEQ